MSKKIAERYKSIVNELYDAVYFVDLEKNITFWNKAAEIYFL